MRILGIDNIVLDVVDLNLARTFYGTVLGLVEKYYFPESGVLGYRIGGEETGLVLRRNPDTRPTRHRGPRVWFEVADTNKATEELTLANVEIVSGPTAVRTGTVIEIADPFGNVIGVVDYSAAPDLARDSLA